MLERGVILTKMIDKNYRKSSDRLVTYDWVDVANGLGYEDFYIMSCLDNTTTTYYLVTKTFKSQQITNTLNANDTNGGVGTVDYNSSTFDAPREIQGKIFVSFSWSGVVGVAGRTYHFKAEVFKVSNGVSTSLGSVRTADQTGSPSVANFVAAIEVAKTPLAVGDNLKVTFTVTITAGTINSTVTSVTFGEDPTGRDTGAFTDPYSSQTKISIPFRVIE